jgi:hypothetical protein
MLGPLPEPWKCEALKLWLFQLHSKPPLLTTKKLGLSFFTKLQTTPGSSLILFPKTCSLLRMQHHFLEERVLNCTTMKTSRNILFSS